ncbi:MAG: hypothetical protein ABW352_12315 [Polyangiales bacterium]
MLRWLLLLLITSPVLAAPPCTGSATELGVTVAVEPEDPELVDRVERHLRAALAARELALCESAGRAGALRITVDEAARARIVVRDALTRKLLERTLELASFPADGRALAIAAAADELLRASWAELLLPDAPPPAPEPELLSVATTALPRSRFELGFEGGVRMGARRGAGLLALRLGSWFRPRWAALVALRGELGAERGSTHGDVRANAVVLEVALAHAFVPIERRRGVSLELGTALALLWFRADANDAGLASSFIRGVWRLDGRLRAWWGPPKLRGSLSAGVSWAARPARAYDEARVVTADQSAAAELTLGLASLF